MKHVYRIALASTVLSLVAACGSQASHSTLTQSNDIGAASSQPSIMVFSKDMRPVDGKLEEVTVKKDEDGTYVVSLRTAFANRETGSMVEKTTVLVDGAKCSFDAYLVSCRKDLRPVDGALTEVNLVTASNGVTIAVLHKVIVDRENGQENESTTTIAKGLSRTEQYVRPITTSIDGTDAKRVDSALALLGAKGDTPMSSFLSVSNLRCDKILHPVSLHGSCTFTTINPETQQPKTIEVLGNYGAAVNGGINGIAVEAKSLRCSVRMIADGPAATCELVAKNQPQ